MFSASTSTLFWAIVFVEFAIAIGLSTVLASVDKKV
jgi:hypothetical protein